MNKDNIVINCPACGYNTNNKPLLYDGMFIICENCGLGWYYKPNLKQNNISTNAFTDNKNKYNTSKYQNRETSYKSTSDLSKYSEAYKNKYDVKNSLNTINEYKNKINTQNNIKKSNTLSQPNNIISNDKPKYLNTFNSKLNQKHNEINNNKIQKNNTTIIPKLSKKVESNYKPTEINNISKNIPFYDEKKYIPPKSFDLKEDNNKINHTHNDSENIVKLKDSFVKKEISKNNINPLSLDIPKKDINLNNNVKENKSDLENNNKNKMLFKDFKEDFELSSSTDKHKLYKPLDIKKNVNIDEGNFRSMNLLQDEYNKYYNIQKSEPDGTLKQYFNNNILNIKQHKRYMKNTFINIKKSFLSMLFTPDKLLYFFAYLVIIGFALGLLGYSKHYKDVKIKASRISNSNINNKDIQNNPRYYIKNTEDTSISTIDNPSDVKNDSKITKEGDLVKDTYKDQTIAYKKSNSIEQQDVLNPDLQNNTNVNLNNSNFSFAGLLSKITLTTKIFKDNLTSNLKIYSGKANWAKNNNENVFSTFAILENHDSNYSYLINSLEVQLTDLSGKVIAKRIILVNQILNSLSKIRLNIKLNNIPFNSYNAYIFIKEKQKIT